MSMSREGYMTLKDIAEHYETTTDKVRTIIARLDIQPRRFPGDLRKLYYSPQDIQRVKEELDLVR